MSRPRKEIDFDEFEKLCAIQCTSMEIAEWFDMCEETLQTRIQEKYEQPFSVIFEQKRSAGKISLRRKQFQTAMNGNVALLIWLGKQYLGQSEKQDIQMSSDPEKKLVINFVPGGIKKESDNGNKT